MSRKRDMPPPAKRRGLATIPLTDVERAAVWTLSEEGYSTRQVADQLGIAHGQVSKVLSQDLPRLEALRAAQREDRSRQMIAMRDLAVRVATKALKKLEAALDNPKLSKASIERYAVLPRAITAAANASFGAEKIAALLTGRPTEIIGTPLGNLSDLSDEDLVRKALESDFPQVLEGNARLLAVAERVKSEKPAEPKQVVVDAGMFPEQKGATV